MRQAKEDWQASWDTWVLIVALTLTHHLIWVNSSSLSCDWGFPVIKNTCANAGDTRGPVQTLNREDPLKEEMATHSSILAWRITWTKEPGGLFHGVTKSLT